MVEVVMKPQKETKGTWRFAEDSDLPVLGTMYIPKPTLASIKWKPGDALKITIEVK